MTNKKQSIIVTIFTLFFVVMQVVFCLNEEVLQEDILGVLIITLIFLAFVWLTIKGKNYARWILSILLIIYSIPISFAGIAINSISIILLGVLSVTFGLILHMPKIKNLSKQNQTEVLSKDINITELPYLTDRYKSILIDNLLIIGILSITLSISNHINIDSIWSRTLCVIIILIYEPILVSYSCTVGQYFAKIRIRNINDPKEKINIHYSYLRFITKYLFGLISLITISFNKNKRAIHDYTSSSIVIKI